MMMMAILVPSRLPVLVSLRKSGQGIALYICSSGWKMTCGGNRLPAVKISSSVTLNRQLNRLTGERHGAGEGQDQQQRRDDDVHRVEEGVRHVASSTRCGSSAG